MLRRNALPMVLTVVLMPFALMASPSRAADLSAATTLDPSGIAVVGAEVVQFRSDDEAHARAFNAALELALANRDDMGYPWIDLNTKTLELAASDDLGHEAAVLAQSSLHADSAGLTVRVRTTQASIAKLDAIADDATRLIDAGIVGANLIWKTEPDQMHNRVVLTVSALNPDLMTALASRYGTKLIAVRIRAGGPASTASRNSDSPPFWGGAHWQAPNHDCTTGFAWNVGSGVSGMVTAAHCISSGGSASYPNYPNAGSVQSGSEENWSDSTGTQYLTGQTVYRGDVALIRYSSSYTSSAYIFSGAPGSSTYSGVYAMASRWSQVGDAVCVNGKTTGEWCGMVTGTGVNIWYLINGVNVWARHVVDATAVGNTCPAQGDSGGPAYRKRTDGKVYAVGILSGSLPIGVACDALFTDIWDAHYGLPGTVKVTG